MGVQMVFITRFLLMRMCTGVYVVAADEGGNVEQQPVVLSGRTLADTSAPRVIRKENVSLTNTSFQAAAALDEPGSMYYVIVEPTPSQQPTSAAARRRLQPSLDVQAQSQGTSQRQGGGPDARRGLLQAREVMQPSF